MKVQIIQRYFNWQKGEVKDLSDMNANKLIKAGIATAVSAQSAHAEVENKAIEADELTTKPTRKRSTK